MAKLTISKGGMYIETVEITKERTSIGRRPENDVVIDHLVISGNHAAIVTILQDAFLEDLNSTNGTWVNGQSIKKHFLKNGDVIELGKFQLEFSTDTVASPHTMVRFEHTHPPRDQNVAMMGEALENVNTDFDQSATISLDLTSDVLKMAAGKPQAKQSIPPPVVIPVAAVAPIAEALKEIPPLPRMGVLQVLNGTRAGKEIELNKSITTLGVPKTQVAAISRRPQGYFLAHVEGAVQTHINGTPVSAAAQALQENDVVELAGTKMMFYYR